MAMDPGSRLLCDITPGTAGMYERLPRPIVAYSAEGAPTPTDIGWQEAIARLARERSLAVTCVGLLRKYGNPGAIDRGTLVYADAKAEFDGIIAGLSVALASRDQPSSLPDLEARLKRGFDKREAFANSVQQLLPSPAHGERGLIGEIVSGAIGPLIEAVKTIWLRSRDDDALMRKTIGTQLEATIWPPFESVSSAA
jgi:hypothetical protein